MSGVNDFQLKAHDLEELRTHRSEKWRAFPADVLPLPVAEMDFPVAEPIRKTLREMIDKSDLGYLGAIPEMGKAFSAFAAKRWGWKADPNQVRIAADVGVGVVEVLRVITQPGDRILINSPVYPNFWTWIAETHLIEVDVPFMHNEMEVDGSFWALDWDGIEKAYSSGIKVHLISNPHNPLGRMFSREELSRFAELAHKYGVIVLSDEIHAPLTYKESTFIPFLTISQHAREIGITITAASKGWNIAGLKCAIIVTEDEKLHERLNSIAPATHYRASLLGAFATVTAFEEGEPWLNALMEKMEINRHLVSDLINQYTPKVSYHLPRCSYLAWLDLSQLNLGDDPAAALVEKAKVAFVPGIRFGKQSNQFVRLNFATSPEILEEAFRRISPVLR
ncbi:MalY Bifunctional PLP-dependent enzyme with beta-cystathionase and maltose regulon repressor activities [Candidatus Nanopelagicaceae bacterium]